jgi:hypothetical protein
VKFAIRQSWNRYRALPPVPRELVTLALCLVFALTVLPLLIWSAGQTFLGEYLRDPSGGRTGGPFALVLDYVRGIASGSLSHWIALLGPYVLLLVLRIFRATGKNVT